VSSFITMSTIIPIVISIVITIVVIFFAMRYMRRVTGADLRTRGEPATAKILQMWDTGTTVNGHPVAGFLLEVQPSYAAAYQVQTTSMIPRLSIGQVQPGATVQVKIDPSNRQRVVIDLYGGAPSAPPMG
jgi:hypothetical protein